MCRKENRLGFGACFGAFFVCLLVVLFFFFNARLARIPSKPEIEKQMEQFAIYLSEWDNTRDLSKMFDCLLCLMLSKILLDSKSDLINYWKVWFWHEWFVSSVPAPTHSQVLHKQLICHTSPFFDCVTSGCLKQQHYHCCSHPFSPWWRIILIFF